MTSAAQDGRPYGPPWQSGAVIGMVGLLALTVLHLVAGAVFSAWNLTDSRRLFAAAVVLAAFAGWALVAAARGSHPRPG